MLKHKVKASNVEYNMLHIIHINPNFLKPPHVGKIKYAKTILKPEP